MGDRHVKQWVWFACECNAVPELAQVIVVEWNPRFTRKMGDASYNPYTFRARIRLASRSGRERPTRRSDRPSSTRSVTVLRL